MLCNAMLYYAILCYAMLHYTTLNYITLHYVTKYHIIFCMLQLIYYIKFCFVVNRIYYNRLIAYNNRHKFCSLANWNIVLRVFSSPVLFHNNSSDASINLLLLYAASVFDANSYTNKIPHFPYVIYNVKQERYFERFWPPWAPLGSRINGELFRS